MNKTLVVCGHPWFPRSFANRHILDEFHKLMPHAEIIHLDALYPDWNIDVEKEQKRLPDVETLIFEFPIMWYGSPSLMHRYVEQVFTHGFAYGSKGKALQGKKFILSFTFGSPEESYTPEGAQHVTVDQLMPPFIAMANLVGLDWKGYIASFAMALLDPANEARKNEILEKASQHAIRLASLAGAQV